MKITPLTGGALQDELTVAVEGGAVTLDLADGATIEILVDDDPCIMRGTIPPGAVVPLHSHDDPETFIGIAGEMEGFVESDHVRVGPGELLHVPGGARHGWRNSGTEPAVTFLISTARMARFFREVAGATPEQFLATSARYGYWNPTPDQSAAAGLPFNP
jgi:mannose-6-phosphate isomerase-like protein (cupin superfamily)